MLYFKLTCVAKNARIIKIPVKSVVYMLFYITLASDCLQHVFCSSLLAFGVT